MELVSIITPTRNRERFLSNAEALVRARTYPRIEWIICDDSPTPSQRFGAAKDDAVRYIHSAVKVSVGEKRNRIADLARGDIIVHFDDDDFYAPSYVETMVARLRQGADMVKLSGWFLYSGLYRSLGYWDCLQNAGAAFRLVECSTDHGPVRRGQHRNQTLLSGIRVFFRLPEAGLGRRHLS